MTTDNFEERRRAFENKFAHDAELQFRVEARRDRYMAQWAAEILGKSDAESDEYIKEVIRADFEEAGDEDVIRKLKADLEGKVTEKEIRARIAEATIRAKGEIIDQGEF